MKGTPQFLYRFFKEKAHAEDFLTGKIRFGLLNYYARIEDKNRKDSSEGVSHFKAVSRHANKNQSSNESEDCYWEELNHTYIFCTSSPNVDLKAAKQQFGFFVVKITKPELFLEDIRSAQFPFEIIAFSLKKVEYSKGEEKEIDLDTYCNEDALSAWQKPPSYASECEYRYILTAKNFESDAPAQFIDVSVRKRSEYLEKLWD